MLPRSLGSTSGKVQTGNFKQMKEVYLFSLTRRPKRGVYNSATPQCLQDLMSSLSLNALPCLAVEFSSCPQPCGSWCENTMQVNRRQEGGREVTSTRCLGLFYYKKDFSKIISMRLHRCPLGHLHLWCHPPPPNHSKQVRKVYWTSWPTYAQILGLSGSPWKILLECLSFTELRFNHFSN